MKLVTPTDFEVLAVLSDGRRNNAVNIAHELELDRPYVNTRLPALQDFGLLTSSGPAPTSGLYEITTKGRIALRNRGLYSEDRSAFEAAVAAELRERETATT